MTMGKIENDIKEHVKIEHGQKPSCPFCLVGFNNQASLKTHVEQDHNENTPFVRVQNYQGRGETHSRKRGPCIFFLQPRGCKKGSQCDFSHERGASSSSIKVHKLCQNGPPCTWKPRCRYVHPEDGEIIPPRASREGARTLRQENRGPREEARASGLEHLRPELREQGFWALLPSLIPPRNTMENFPGLGQPKNLGMFRPWAT